MSEGNSDYLTPRERSNANLKPFPKGRSGNPKGRAPGKSMKRLLRDVAESQKRAVIETMYELAKGGDVRAAEWIAKHEEGNDTILEHRVFSISATPPRPENEDVEASECPPRR